MDPNLLAMAPLLNVAVKGEWTDNEFTAQMTGETRADNTNRLLARLLGEASATAPLLLVLEELPDRRLGRGDAGDRASGTRRGAERSRPCGGSGSA